ncbi:pyruvate dehydrogenase E2 component (dihydrolipoamide acetyltransferase) [Actinomycetospora succinea]|uniref:Dihydrolipoamide acetyltransferase component of pyruvate dehydrogenase complex n=1 Tax=Actinomycetospora succinea TaxID=663603 RepID=A0A4V3DB18_9PSEU|nr:dihydrolipoamide acetyltransferase family protein [Actinomycetospora succinea]TDQ64818.1 pyruvate dehydrogenase E2 component (dihydrolipoamide acetyltransferase) [Actinomycetospora succinea]
MSSETFRLPDVGEGLTEAEILAWHVAVGDEVAVNQVIVEVETAKAAVELPCPFDGTVAELLVAEGETVAVGSPIIAVTTGADEPPPVTSEDGGESESSGSVLVGYGTSATATRRRRRHPATPEPVTASPGAARPPATPPVRMLAKELGVDLADVAFEGDRIRREDVRRHVDAPTDPPAADRTGDERRVPIKGVRKATAAAMTASAFTAPHVTEFVTVDVTAMTETVETLRAHRAFADVRVTPLLLVARALLSAARHFPDINARWDEENQEIVYPHAVNLGIAAATPRGLLVPNIKDAPGLTLVDLARALAELTTTARAGRITPEQMAGGTITITNVGVFGVDAATPILNPGEAAILCFGAVRRRPWEYRGEIALRDVTQLSLSFDHRLVDGELGSRVLARVAAVLADPAGELLLD